MGGSRSASNNITPRTDSLDVPLSALLATEQYSVGKFLFGREGKTAVWAICH